ncbi:hypothetical protein EJ377_07795 [Chryseobacterium arthrosphaerae]|uniref:Uncharacterized protein n=1 Tax=Chryseobacterium arthrosphaerae TaxID=651561 RepID=A0A3S0NPC2_9FLAO|nr:hypothetical protein EJ377_07795 [Chryseobacterium arthrosphaerae]
MMWEENRDTYSAILYNVSGQLITFSYNSNAYHNPKVSTYQNLFHTQGVFIDGDDITYYREAQNIYVTINSPAKWAGRKFLIGINIFKEDTLSTVALGGNGSDKTNQSMLTYIFEFK